MLTDLQAVRRIDWRFLLPDAALDRVGCVLPADDLLVDALGRFSQRCRVIEPSELSTLAATCDVVVIRDPRWEHLEKVAAAVTPDGAMYLELSRRWRLDSAIRRRDLPRRLSALGFAEVRPHWLWPTFAEPAMLSVLEGAPMRYALSRRARRKPLRVLLARVLLRLGLLHWVVGEVSVVAQRRTFRTRP